MRKTRRWSYAFRCIAVVVIVVASIAFLTRPQMPPVPLSPAEMAIIGTWAYSGEKSEILYSATFNTDRTVVFDGPQPKYPSRWRIEGAVLVFQHKYQTVIGNTPFPIPAAVKRLELPAIMAHKEEVLRPMTLSPDGCSMTLAAVSGVAPACTLARTKANASNGSENEPVITE